MTIGQELEHLRRAHDLSILDMCNILDCSEPEYYRIVRDEICLSVYQLVCAIIALQNPLKSVLQSPMPPYHILNPAYKDYEY